MYCMKQDLPDKNIYRSPLSVFTGLYESNNARFDVYTCQRTTIWKADFVRIESHKQIETSRPTCMPYLVRSHGSRQMFLLRWTRGDLSIQPTPPPTLRLFLRSSRVPPLT